MNAKPTNSLLQFMDSSNVPSEMPVNDAATRSAAGQKLGGTPRLRHPNRRQMELQPYSLDQLLPEEHEARIAFTYTVSISNSDSTPGLPDRYRALRVTLAT